MAKIEYKTLVGRAGEDHKAPLETEYEILSIKDFVAKYHPGLAVESIGYCIEKGKVDYTVPYNGRERFIVVTPHTLSYKPITHPSRDKSKV